MEHGQAELVGGKPVIFGQRKVRPRACVAVGKRHLRAFLRDVLEDIGFVISECGTADELSHVLGTDFPDLICSALARIASSLDDCSRYSYAKDLQAECWRSAPASRSS